MSKYVLENTSEFDRLEKQSQNKAYHFESELAHFQPKPTATILDAGCGSGVVSRYLAQRFPQSTVIGCDFSAERVKQAAQHASAISNLSFQEENLAHLTVPSSSVDAIVCRYVLEHLSEADIHSALSEFYRCMRPNASICAIDMDGLLSNIFPRTPAMQKALTLIESQRTVDLYVGRKLPHFLAQANFVNIQWRIETLSFQGEGLLDEMQIIRERFQQIAIHLERTLQDAELAKKFTEEYLHSLAQPGAVLFYNKFIVTAEKQGFRK
jgi:ubiquinone/menaquinone biosynthesis C-methylase UbiE